MLWRYLHILILLLSTCSLLAEGEVDMNDLPKHLLAISDDLYYDYNKAIDKIDSIESSLTETARIEFKPYFCYFNAFRAYKSSDYTHALTHADSALTFFLWHENDEWEARCVLTMAFTAEALTLDNYALSYYETASQLSKDNVVKGLSLLGLARSKNKLREDTKDIVKEAIDLLESTNIIESHLLAIRSYFLFNRNDENLVPELLKVEQEYLKLGNLVYAATTNKQLSYYYRSTDDYVNAEKFAIKALDQINMTRDSVSVFSGSLYMYTSNILLIQNRLNKAQNYIEKAIDINNELNINQSNYYAYQRLSELNRHYEDYKSAYQNSQNAINCQIEMYETKRSGSALLAEVLINRDYIDRELNKTKIYQYIRLGLFVVISLVFFRGLINRFRRQVEAKDVEVVKLQEDNTVLQKNAMEMLSIVKKLEKESSLLTASEDFEKRLSKDVELSTTLPKDFCNAYQKNISSFSFEHNKLSQAEVRTAVMLAMEIPSKSIVKLQCIEPDTLKTYRKRIRRKLKLEPGIDLNVHLKTLLYELGKNV